MDDETIERKLRLERELRFIKDSLDSDIITKEEYERSRQRIERKLQEIEEKEEPTAEQESKEITEETPQKSDEMTEVEYVNEDEWAKEQNEGQAKLEVVDIEPAKAEEEPQAQESIEEKQEEQIVEEKKNLAYEDAADKGVPKGVEEKAESGLRETEEEKSSYGWVWAVIGVLLIVLSFYVFTQKAPSEGEKIALPFDTPKIIENQQELPLPVCSSDSDCVKEKMVGICENPGTVESSCTFIEPIAINLVILNDKKCKSCDTGPTLKMIETMFPGVKYSVVDIGTEEGKKLIKEFDIKVIPTYIFDSNVSKSQNYEDVKRAFIQKQDNYIMSTYSSGANYYFKRASIKNKLELYGIKGAANTEKAERNIMEVTQLFGHKASYDKYLVEEGQKDIKAEELGINTYPVLLINNQFKLSGIYPAETIKQKFCEWNQIPECNSTLSMELK